MKSVIKFFLIFSVLISGITIGARAFPASAGGGNGSGTGGSTSPPVVEDPSPGDEYVAPERERYSHDLTVYAPCCGRQYSVLQVSHEKIALGSYGVKYENLHCCIQKPTVPPELLIEHKYEGSVTCQIEGCSAVCDHMITQTMIDRLEQLKGMSPGLALNEESVCQICNTYVTPAHSYEYYCYGCDSVIDVRYNGYPYADQDFGAYGSLLTNEHSHDDGEYGSGEIELKHVYTTGTGKCDALGCNMVCNHVWTSDAQSYFGKESSSAMVSATVDGVPGVQCEICHVFEPYAACASPDMSSLNIEACEHSPATVTLDMGAIGYVKHHVCSDEGCTVEQNSVIELHRYGNDGICTGCYRECDHIFTADAVTAFELGFLNSDSCRFSDYQLSGEYDTVTSLWEGNAADHYGETCLICGQAASGSYSLRGDTGESALPPENNIPSDEE